MDSREELGLEETTLSHVDAGLVKELDKIFPLRLPEMNSRNREIWIAVGQRNVIDFLKEHLKRQNENVLR